MYADLTRGSQQFGPSPIVIRVRLALVCSTPLALVFSYCTHREGTRRRPTALSTAPAPILVQAGAGDSDRGGRAPPALPTYVEKVDGLQAALERSSDSGQRKRPREGGHALPPIHSYWRHPPPSTFGYLDVTGQVGWGSQALPSAS